MSKLYDVILSECSLKEFNKATFFEKRVYNDIKIYIDEKDPLRLSRFYSEKYVKWNDMYHKVELPKALDTDVLSNCTNLKNFISKFGERVMLIYNYILLEKRVLFIGNKQSKSIMAG